MVYLNFFAWLCKDRNLDPWSGTLVFVRNRIQPFRSPGEVSMSWVSPKTFTGWGLLFNMIKLFFLIFECTFTSKIKSHKTVEIKVFLLFCQPDPGVLQTYASGSTTLLRTLERGNYFCVCVSSGEECCGREAQQEAAALRTPGPHRVHHQDRNRGVWRWRPPLI